MATRPTPVPEPLTDLVAKARSGSREAYDELFAMASERLHLYLQLRVGDALRQKEESLDLLQETYLAAIKAFADFEPCGERAFVAWLCRIAENCIRTRVDFHGAAKRTPPEELARASRVMDKLRTRSLGPATRAERQDCRRSLAEAARVIRLSDKAIDADAIAKHIYAKLPVTPPAGYLHIPNVKLSDFEDLP